MMVCLDARILQSTRRGQGQYLYYLVKYMARAFPGDNFKLFYNGLSCPPQSNFRGMANVVEAVSMIPGTALREAWHLFGRPRVESLIGECDIFHNTINFSFTHYSPVPSAAPMVATFHGMADPSSIWDKYDNSAIEGWLKRISSQARAVIAVSEAAGKDLVKRTGMDPARIKVIYHGVDPIFRPIPPDAAAMDTLSRYGLSGKRYMLYVGASDRNKNLEGLVKAFSGLRADPRARDIHLALVGEQDTGHERLKTVSEKIGLKNIIFTGYIPQEELPVIYSGALAFVFPTFHEWFGMPLLEAMACGVPVAASNTEGIPEVVGRDAVLFDPNDAAAMTRALLELATDKALAEKLSRAGLSRAAGFTWDRTAARTMDVYREALGMGVQRWL